MLQPSESKGAQPCLVIPNRTRLVDERKFCDGGAGVRRFIVIDNFISRDVAAQMRSEAVSLRTRFQEAANVNRSSSHDDHFTGVDASPACDLDAP